ncbi:Swi3-domain-containing protein [Cylindrobasidium torrendii FP15055 ss-10]|uniref:Chromosome segregation in meiosis protein n=1 Tax=Cylindrobasidium torrendii FP15055 ss-10 TaxID=1314674 RepID=A0A0D7BPR0_9AGAR|nr:Swi3-domain-containing protein [Cylindrobasidium torrendii FP15055 ss-10]
MADLDLFATDNDVEEISRNDEPLFLPDGTEPNVDDIFEGIENDDIPNEPVAPSNSTQRGKATQNKQSQRELRSSPPPAFGDEDADKDKPKKKARPQLLNELLLIKEERGFPALIRDTKDFKLRGKGHEQEDLNRLLSRYQFWIQRLHPKAQFSDSVNRIEKLCKTRLMHSHMTSWRDEALGITHENEDDEDEGAPMDPKRDASALVSEPDPLSDTAAAHTSSPGPPTRPPSSPGVSSGPSDFPDDDEINALMQQEVEAQSKPAAGLRPTMDDDFMDEDEWLMDQPDVPTASTSKTNNNEEDMFGDDDVDMDAWDQVEQQTQAKPQSSPPKSTGKPRSNANGAPLFLDSDDDLEDLYAS